ncbi:MAG: beta-ketoacyl-ACP synthase III [bacterium]
MFYRRSILRAYIKGIGYHVPDNVITNFDLERMVDTSNEWIIERTGIIERRFASENEASSDLATVASKKAMEMAGVSPEDIELILLATVTPDMFFPSTACIVQANIGAKNAGAFDFLAGCTGFVYGLEIAQQFIENGKMKNILVIGVETLSRIMDMSDRNTCVLFGDGAGAAVVSAHESDDKGILSSYIKSDGSLGDLLKMPAGGSRIPASIESVKARLHYIKMEGNEVFKNAVRGMNDAATKALEMTGMKGEMISLLIPHQANIRIIQAVQKRVGIPDERVYVNLDRFGNTSSGSIPIALGEAYERGLVKEGDYILLVAFGAGFTWGSVLLKW